MHMNDLVLSWYFDISVKKWGSENYLTLMMKLNNTC